MRAHPAPGLRAAVGATALAALALGTLVPA